MDRCNALGLAGVLSSSGWDRAAACGPDGGNCVEVNFSVAGHVAVRDSKRYQSPVLVFHDYEWQSFLIAARAGRYGR